MLKLVFAALLIATPAIAQEAKPDILAIDEEDAQSCAKGCRMITDRAYELIAARLQRAEAVEEMAQRMAAELKRKPQPKYCL